MGGDGVRLLNTSVGSGRGVQMVLDVLGVNTLLPLPDLGLVVGTDSGLYVVPEYALTCTGGHDVVTGNTHHTVETFANGAGLHGFNGSKHMAALAPLALAARFIYGLASLPGGLLAVGTDQGVLLLHRIGLMQGTPTLAALSLHNAHVTSLLSLPGGGLAVGTLDGLVLFDADALRPSGGAHAKLAAGSAVWALLLLPGRELLVGTSAWSAGSVNLGALLYPPEQWLPGGRPTATLAAGVIVWSLASLLDGAAVAVGGSDGVFLFDLESVQTSTAHTVPCSADF